ncbi:MAG: hypothetical protein WDZ26_06550 [Nitriliruptoraceae bacterium]
MIVHAEHPRDEDPEAAMAPAQCPSCARFLSAAFVTSLGGGPQACPGCATSLTADQFDGVDAPDEPDEADVLDGWDVGGEASSWRDDQPPFPVDAAWVGGGAAVGALLGMLTTRRVGGLFTGALLGAAAVGAARRVWELDADT